MYKIDKTHWKSFTFGQIASNISERVEPGETDLSIYVGLEHLDSNSIHITRFGKPSDVQGTKLRVYKGDVIFGKRRAYQRKAAIAEFDGICSAHAMVLQANKNMILPELFPFLLHSDAFMNKAIDISEGSLSPTIKWKTLANQTFTIPPFDEQKKIADLLWSGDQLLVNYNLLNRTLTTYFEKLKIDVFNRYKTLYKLVPLFSIADFINGKAFKPSEWEKTGIPIIRIQNINNHQAGYNRTNKKHEDKYRISDGDILFSWSATLDVSIWNKGPAWLNQHIYKVTPKKELGIDKTYLFYLLKWFIDGISSFTHGTTMMHITRAQLSRMTVPLPDNKIQKETALLFLNIDSTIADTLSVIRKTTRIQRSLINNFFTK